MGVEENRLRTKFSVKVRYFPSATIDDMYSYLIALLEKQPEVLILHVGTNDAPKRTSQEIIKSLLNLKSFIAKKLPDCNIIISTPVKRTDDWKAMLTIKKVSEIACQLELNTIDNSNINENHLGRKGLHLNRKGTGRLVLNFLNKIKNTILWLYDAKGTSVVSESIYNLARKSINDQIEVPSNIDIGIENEEFDTVLNNVRKDNVNNVIFACLNINSLANKFDQLTTVINDNIDILVLVETKLDDTFPESQFFINGFIKPYRIDLNRNGGGVMIYVRQDIPSKRLSKHNLPSDIECLCVEINLRKIQMAFVWYFPST